MNTGETHRTNEEIAGFTDKDRLALHEVRLNMHGHTLTNMLGTIDILTERIDQLVQTASPGLAKSLVTGVKHDAELIRNGEREVRVDELTRMIVALWDDMREHDAPILNDRDAGIQRARYILTVRRRELEQAGGGTDDADRTEG